jgi:hypothetical protein
MSPAPATWLALRRELPSVSLDFLTGREIGAAQLRIGTIVEDAHRALDAAAQQGTPTVVVRARCAERPEWIGLERVVAHELRAALG